MVEGWREQSEIIDASAVTCQGFAKAEAESSSRLVEAVKSNLLKVKIQFG